MGTGSHWSGDAPEWEALALVMDVTSQVGQKPAGGPKARSWG